MQDLSAFYYYSPARSLGKSSENVDSVALNVNNFWVLKQNF
jgi:hypothetical protein